MNDTELQSSPITLDRRLVLGEIDYQVTAFPTDDHRIDLCIVSSDPDGRMVSEVSAGIAPSDLPGLTDVLTSTLAGLIAMTQPALSSRSPSPRSPAVPSPASPATPSPATHSPATPSPATPSPATHSPSPRRDRPPNQGARWTESDDSRLLTRYHAGARLRDLTTEFGRSSGGIRARLEFLGALAPGAPWQSTPPPAPPPAAAPAVPPPHLVPTGTDPAASGPPTDEPPPAAPATTG